MVQLLLVSGVIGELSIASAALPKLAFAVFGHPISHLLSWRHRFESRPAGGRSRAMPRLNVCEPAFTVKPVFRFTNTLISPELPCAASACDSSGMKGFPTKAMSFSEKWLSISSCAAPSIGGASGSAEWMAKLPPGLRSIWKANLSC